MCLINRLLWLALLAVLVPEPAPAQQTRAGVTMTGRVSGFAAVSAGPDARALEGHARVSAGRVGAHTLAVSLSDLAGEKAQVDIPVRVRSNVAFTLKAAPEGGGAALLDLCVVGVSGAGRFVYPGAAGRVEVPAAFEGRRGARPAAAWDLSSPVALLHGPAVSAGGALDSPENTLEVVLRVVVKAPAGSRHGTARLKISVAPRRQGL